MNCCTGNCNQGRTCTMRVGRVINSGQPKLSNSSRLYIKGLALIIFSAVTVNFFSMDGDQYSKILVGLLFAF